MVHRFSALFCCLLVAGAVSTCAGEDMNPFVYIAGYHNTVTCFKFDMTTGELKPSSTSDAGKNPTYMAISPNKKFMYAANETDKGRVSAFSINSKDGSLTKLNDVSAVGDAPCHVSVSHSGKWLFVANYSSGTIGVMPIKADGSLGEALEQIQAGKNAHQIFQDSTGKFVFVPCLGSEYVAQYTFDDATGALKPNDPATTPIPIKYAVDKETSTLKPNDPPIANAKAGPRHSYIHPNNKFAYVINELNCTLISFNYNAAKGTYSDPEAVLTVPAGTDMKGKSTAHVMTSPDGKFLYGSNRGYDTIIIYSIDQSTGRLKEVGHENGGGDVKFPRDFNIDPSGKYVLVASQKGNSVTVFKRDAEKGTLTKLNTVTVPNGPSYVGFLVP